jgi:hypothetical protein
MYALICLDPLSDTGRRSPETVPTKAGWRWVPIVTEARPDTATGFTVDSLPTVTETALVQGWTAPRPQTEIELFGPVPQTVTALQLRRALLQAGKLGAVETAVTAAGPEALLIWEYMTEASRHDPLLTAIAANAGLSDPDIDAVFRAAVL